MNKFAFDYFTKLDFMGGARGRSGRKIKIWYGKHLSEKNFRLMHPSHKFLGNFISGGGRTREATKKWKTLTRNTKPEERNRNDIESEGSIWISCGRVFRVGFFGTRQSSGLNETAKTLCKAPTFLSLGAVFTIRWHVGRAGHYLCIINIFSVASFCSK